jgi:hypothetical protein
MFARTPRPHRAVLGASAILAAAGLALISACSTGSERPAATVSAQPRVAAVPVMIDGRGRLPLRDYTLTVQQVVMIDRARLTLIDRCMQRFGFRYRLRLPDQPDDGGLGRRYGVLDPEQAAERGYARVPPKQPADPPLTEVQRTALFGGGQPTIDSVAVPAGGCLDDANRVLQAGLPDGADLDLGQKLMVESFARSRRDTRVLTVVGRWSQCMADAGYHYQTPLDPPGDPAFTKHPKAGIRVARADVRCKQETNLTGIWFAVESAYQKDSIARNAAALRRTRQALDIRLAFATDVPS